MYQNSRLQTGGKMEKVSMKGLAAGLGVSWGGFMLIIGWGSCFGWGTKLLEAFSNIYIGFNSSFLGGIIGLIWGFVDGALGGAIIALVYNFVSRKQKKICFRKLRSHV